MIKKDDNSVFIWFHNLISLCLKIKFRSIQSKSIWRQPNKTGCTHYHTVPHLAHYRSTALENIVRKGEIACKKQFLLFSQCFPSYMALIFHFKCTWNCCLQFVTIWTSLKFLCCLVMGWLMKFILGCGKFLLFSSTGRRPASYCHGIVSVVRPSGLGCVCKLFLKKISPQKLLTGFLWNCTGMFLRWSSFKFFQIIVFYEDIAMAIKVKNL